MTALKHYNVVAAVVEVDGKVLCMQRGKTRFAYTSHLWEFPGGKIELAAYRCTAATMRFTMREHAASRWLLWKDLHKLPWCAADARLINLFPVR